MRLHYRKELLVSEVESGFIHDESVLRCVDNILVRFFPPMGMPSLSLLVVVNLNVWVVDLLHKCHGSIIAPDL